MRCFTQLAFSLNAASDSTASAAALNPKIRAIAAAASARATIGSSLSAIRSSSA
jgi:hypothetical protein